MKQEAFENVGPIRHCEPPPRCHSPGVATVPSHAACASMSTTTTTTRDRGTAAMAPWNGPNHAFIGPEKALPTVARTSPSQRRRTITSAVVTVERTHSRSTASSDVHQASVTRALRTPRRYPTVLRARNISTSTIRSRSGRGDVYARLFTRTRRPLAVHVQGSLSLSLATVR